MKVLDTSFLIDCLKGKKECLKIIESNDVLFTTQINMFEVLRGIFRQTSAKSKVLQSIELFDSLRVLPLDDNSIIKSADISAELISKGKPIQDNDCLIAGIALSKGVNTIVTKDKHFERILGIKVISY